MAGAAADAIRVRADSMVRWSRRDVIREVVPPETAAAR